MGDGIKTVCGWCGVLMQDGPLDAAGRESHGICPACKVKVLGDFAQQALDVQAGVDKAEGVDRTVMVKIDDDGHYVPVDLEQAPVDLAKVGLVKHDAPIDISGQLLDDSNPDPIEITLDVHMQTFADGIVKAFGALGSAGTTAADAIKGFGQAMLYGSPSLYMYPQSSPWMAGGDLVDKDRINDWTPEAPSRAKPEPFKPAPEPHTRKIELDEDE